MISEIQFHPTKASSTNLFSILIPSWNNLAYLKCCVESIRKNSRFQHEIIVHVNEGKDGTLEWVKSQNLSHTYSEGNVGVCYGFNAPASLATCEYIVLSDDDFYYAPDWDFYLNEEIKKIGHRYFCITSTLIEHSPTSYASMIAPHNFGMTVETFNEPKFLKEYQTIPFADWNGANWYPLVLHRHLYNLIGGLSIEFSPGISSDPDMMMKLWHCGVRYFKGVGDSRVYHFVSKSVKRVMKPNINDGNNQFLMKWGLSKSTFFDAYLRLGKKFLGYTAEPDWSAFKIKLRRDKAKRLFSSWRKNLPA
jgi:glycosyltransferase involved in cell wall biosynthesis